MLTRIGEPQDGLTVDGGDIRCQDWSDENVASNKVLSVDPEELWFVREFEEQRTDWRCTEL